MIYSHFQSLQLYLASLMLVCSAFASVTNADDARWSRFRGESGSGIADDAPLPAEFGPEKNLLWKTPLASGHSSPCIWGKHLFLTTYDSETKTLGTVAIDRFTGQVLWTKAAPVEKIERVHLTSSPAASTPTTDGERVYVYFGSFGVLCYDFTGNEIWKKELPSPRAMHGSATSPVVSSGTLFVAVHGGSLTALDSETGEIKWTNEARFPASYCVPLIRETDDGTQVVLQSSGGITAIDARSGNDLWWLDGLAADPVSSPVVDAGFIYCVTHYPGSAADERVDIPSFDNLLAEYDKDEDGNISRHEIPKSRVVLSRGAEDGTGDVSLSMIVGIAERHGNKNGILERTEWQGAQAFMAAARKSENAILAIRPGTTGALPEENIIWKEKRGLPEIPSALLYRGNLYAVKDGGIVSCLDAETGDLHYRSRLGSSGLNYASPVAGDGKIFVASRDGSVVVFEAGNTFRKLATNRLDELMAATPAIVDGTIYVRTEKHLFAFEK